MALAFATMPNHPLPDGKDFPLQVLGHSIDSASRLLAPLLESASAVWQHWVQPAGDALK